jgi:hypothetical protein
LANSTAAGAICMNAKKTHHRYGISLFAKRHSTQAFLLTIRKRIHECSTDSVIQEIKHVKASETLCCYGIKEQRRCSTRLFPLSIRESAHEDLADLATTSAKRVRASEKRCFYGSSPSEQRETLGRYEFSPLEVSAT